MEEKHFEDVGAPNPRQAEVDRIRDAAAAHIGRGERQSAAREVAGRVSERLVGDDAPRVTRAD